MSATLPIPEWVAGIQEIRMTPQELAALPEYSCTLPDSYKRPISEGGRPWKRDLNFFGKFAPAGEKIWIYCEYIPDPDPKFLAVLNKRVALEATR